jgi:hypothetical protein
VVAGIQIQCWLTFVGLDCGLGREIEIRVRISLFCWRMGAWDLIILHLKLTDGIVGTW